MKNTTQGVGTSFKRWIKGAKKSLNGLKSPPTKPKINAKTNDIKRAKNVLNKDSPSACHVEVIPKMSNRDTKTSLKWGKIKLLLTDKAIISQIKSKNKIPKISQIKVRKFLGILLINLIR